MDDTNAHPSDETLFDLVEGLLDPAEAARVEEHLDRCSACAAFTTASLNGSVADVGMSLVETMPEAAAERMHVALAQAWRTRTATIAAEESAQDAASTPAPTTAPASDAIATTELAAPAIEAPAPRPADRRTFWTRRLVPVLAFAVLATLAGASILIDDQPTSSSTGGGATADSVDNDNDDDSGSSSSESAGAGSGLDEPSAEPDYSDVQPDPDEFDGSNGITPPSTGEAPASAPAAPGAVDAGKSLEDAARQAGEGDVAAGGTTGSAAEVAPGEGTQAEPSDTEAPEEIPTIEPVCIATLDNTRLYLPDGRIPNQIVRGPLGVYVVCG